MPAIWERDERPETWTLLPYDAGSSHEHFALSDALVRHVIAPTIWWHSAHVPTLILGPTQSRSRASMTGASDIPRVYRHAGGTAVFATPSVLGLDVALPSDHRAVVPDIVEAYRWLGETWVSALALLGVEAQIVTPQRARLPNPEVEPIRSLVAAACFGGLSPYEVVIGDRKVVGLAQVRRRQGQLLQSGIHLHFDADRLASLLAPELQSTLADSLRRHAVGLREVVPETIAFVDVIGAFHEALRTRHLVELQESDWPENVQIYARATMAGA
ncbi:MAG: ligase [Chloroflexota bacterium]